METLLSSIAKSELQLPEELGEIQLPDSYGITGIIAGKHQHIGNTKEARAIIYAHITLCPVSLKCLESIKL